MLYYIDLRPTPGAGPETRKTTLGARGILFRDARMCILYCSLSLSYHGKPGQVVGGPPGAGDSRRHMLFMRPFPMSLVCFGYQGRIRSFSSGEQ